MAAFGVGSEYAGSLRVPAALAGEYSPRPAPGRLAQGADPPRRHQSSFSVRDARLSHTSVAPPHGKLGEAPHAVLTADEPPLRERSAPCGPDAAATRGRGLNSIDSELALADSLTELAGLTVGAADFLAAALGTAAPPLWVVDPDDVIRFANPAAVTALGYDSADELLGRRSHETIRCRDSNETPSADCQVLEPRATGQAVARDVVRLVRRDGSTFPVSVVSVPAELPEGRGAVVAFAEIGDRVRGGQVLRAREVSLPPIAALVAGGAASADVFAAIAREVGHVIGLPLVVVFRYEPDGTTATVIGAWSEAPHPFQTGTRWPLDEPTRLVRILKAGRPARTEDYGELPGTIADAGGNTGLGAAAGAPIIVDGHVWGAMTATARGAPLPDHVEDRLAEFSELVASAIANAENRAGLARLAAEQGALRRVATLVARGTRPEEVFATVANEVSRLLSADLANVCRYEPDGTLTFVASASERFPAGSRWPLSGQRNLATLVLETGRPARLDNYADATGPLAEDIREAGVRSAVATPIIVDGRLWGLIAVGSGREQRMPADTEARLASFTELVATAIANTEARTEIAASRARIVAAADQERHVGDIFDLSPDLLCVASLDGYFQRVNSAFERTLGYPSAELLSRPLLELVHPDDRDRTAEMVGALSERRPVLDFENRCVRADGAVRWLQWNARAVPERGVMYAAARDITENRMLSQEQAALRRVATLVAQGHDAFELFDAVAGEVGRLLGADATRLLRYRQDGTTAVVGSYGIADAELGADSYNPGARWRRIAERAGAAAAPIVVSGRPWGAIVAAWKQREMAGGDAEIRIGQFTELVATAVANAESSAELAASRRRIVTAADEARRQIERDLHDGAQQRLVHAIIMLKLAQRAFREENGKAESLVGEALEHAERGIHEMRELARGIHPKILSSGGLGPALDTLARRSPIPATVVTQTDARLPEPVEVTAYYVASEALTNAAKHARASAVEIAVDADDRWLVLTIRDDGIGDADPSRGSGLISLGDRVQALGGALEVRSETGAGTELIARIPVATPAPT
jgi:PAS domain S-box-containing protein